MARRIKDKYASRYLKVDDLQDQPLALTITRIADEAIGEDKAEKFVIYSRETRKGLVLNKTNADTIAEYLDTDDVDTWIGATLVLTPAKTTFGGKRVPCIRVTEARFPKKPTPLFDAERHELEAVDEEKGTKAKVVQ